MPPAGFKCKQCGNCCLNLMGAFETCATEEDVLFCPEKPGPLGHACPALRGSEIDGSALEFCV